MGYCAICGRQHDPDLPCNDTASQALRDAGISKHRHNSGARYMEAARQADRWFLKVLLALLALIAAIAILSVILERRAY